MTMNDIKAMTDDWITPATAARALKMDAGRLIQYARDGQLPFATQISGNRVKISRKSFLNAYGEGEPENQKADIIPEVLKELQEIRTILAALMNRKEA